MLQRNIIALKGITSTEKYEDGSLKSCIINEENQIETALGLLTPRFSPPDERKKDSKALSFYPDGVLQSIALEQQTRIETPIGGFPAELLTFHPNGALSSLFPLNGQIGFGWTEEDEGTLTELYHFSFPFGKFDTKIIGMRFYPSGKLKSLMLWPGEMVTIQAPFGEILIRNGFKLYEDGALQSFEPAYPTKLMTPVGEVMAFDHLALGIDSDFNSVKLSTGGSLVGFSTNSDIVVNNTLTKDRVLFYQQLRLEMESDKMMKLPIRITFQSTEVCLDNGVEKQSFNLTASKFLFLYDGSYQQSKCSPGSDCSNCGGNCL